MSQEIYTDTLSTEQIWEELRFFAEHFLQRGHETCELLFAFAWGNEYYDTNVWYPELVPLADLVAKVKEVESSGIGRLGDDDLFIKIPGVNSEFRFDHRSGIYLRYSTPDETTKHFLARWASLGFSPRERQVKERE